MRGALFDSRVEVDDALDCSNSSTKMDSLLFGTVVYPPKVYAVEKYADIWHTMHSSALQKARKARHSSAGRSTWRLISYYSRLFRYFTLSSDGVLRINGPPPPTSQGYYELTVIARDGGDPPLETRGQVVINVVQSTSSQGTTSTRV